MRCLIGLLFLFGSMVAPTANADKATPRSLETAIQSAIALCAVSTRASSGETVRIKGQLDSYVHVSPKVAQILKSRSMGIKTTHEAPELFKRFAATASHSGAFGARDMQVLGADGGIVLIVRTAKHNMCDIGVIGIEPKEGLAGRIRGALGSMANWEAVPEKSNASDIVWNEAFTYNSENKEENIGLITVRGVADAMAKPEGIQAEINFFGKPRNFEEEAKVNSSESRAIPNVSADETAAKKQE